VLLSEGIRGRMLQSRKPAGIAFTRVKNQHQGRLVTQIHVKLHMADGHMGPKISSQLVQGWESPKISKNSLTDFQKFRGFYAHKSVSNLT